jgi:hypothetical protein
VAPLFQQVELRQYLESHLIAATKFLEELPEAGFNERPIADRCETLELDTQWIAGGVENVPTGPPARVTQWNLHIWAEYSWSGNGELFWCLPTEHHLMDLHADVKDGRVRVDELIPGRTAKDVSEEQAKAPLDRTIGRIANMVGYANNEVREHNRLVENDLRQVIDAKRSRVLSRDQLAERLGFPLERRDDAPRPVPLERRVLGLSRPKAAGQTKGSSYQAEWELLQSAYEDVLSIIGGMLKALERTPSVAEKKPSVAASRDHEEFLRDILLVTLNGTFKGAATGETFVKTGKTDILVSVEDRHVFVGECKWWDGQKTITEATDQLLDYLPWRNEKAALIIFIDRAGASEILEKADEALRSHRNFESAATDNPDPNSRRDYVFRQPSDPDREISLAMLFAVIQ